MTTKGTSEKAEAKATPKPKPKPKPKPTARESNVSMVCTAILKLVELITEQHKKTKPSK